MSLITGGDEIQGFPTDVASVIQPPALEGTLIVPGDSPYKAARKVFHRLIDRRPTFIARVASTDDVVRAVNHACDNGLPLAVRGGGHNVAGNAVCDDGLVIDFSDF